MSSVNKVILIGRIGKDPETKFTTSGMQITNFSVATSEKFKKNENWEEKTEWHNIVTFDKTAKVVADYCKKGNQVYVEGKLQTSSWETESGEKKYKTEIIGNVVKNLTPKPKNNEGNQQQENNSNSNNQSSGDDLPF